MSIRLSVAGLAGLDVVVVVEAFTFVLVTFVLKPGFADSDTATVTS